MTLAGATFTILSKELRIEARSKQLFTTTLIFVLVVLLLFSRAFDPSSAESRRFGPGLLWVAFLFAGSLMLQSSFVREQPNDTLAALRLAPIDPFSILAGKLASNFLFLLLVEVLMLPVFAVLYNVPLVPVLGRLLIVLVLGTLGLAATGTVFSAVAAQARLRELLLPLLLLPLLAPLLIGSAKATAELLDEQPQLDRAGVGFLVAFDVIFLTASWLFGEYLLEE